MIISRNSNFLIANGGYFWGNPQGEFPIFYHLIISFKVFLLKIYIGTSINLQNLNTFTIFIVKLIKLIGNDVINEVIDISIKNNNKNTCVCL